MQLKVKNDCRAQHPQRSRITKPSAVASRPQAPHIPQNNVQPDIECVITLQDKEIAKVNTLWHKASASWSHLWLQKNKASVFREFDARHMKNVPKFQFFITHFVKICTLHANVHQQIPRNLVQLWLNGWRPHLLCNGLAFYDEGTFCCKWFTSNWNPHFWVTLDWLRAQRAHTLEAGQPIFDARWAKSMLAGQ